QARGSMLGRVMYLARRSEMAPRMLAGIALRPRSTLLATAPLIVALTTVGCSHNRASYRPIYASPAPVVAPPPCTNCDPDGAPIAPIEPGAAPSSTVPLLPEAPGAEVSVPPASGRAVRSGASRGSAVESTPKSRIGNEPGDGETPPKSRIGNE